jgi:hypothetical protein
MSGGSNSTASRSRSDWVRREALAVQAHHGQPGERVVRIPHRLAILARACRPCSAKTAARWNTRLEQSARLRSPASEAARGVAGRAQRGGADAALIGGETIGSEGKAHRE